MSNCIFVSNMLTYSIHTFGADGQRLFPTCNSICRFDSDNEGSIRYMQDLIACLHYHTYMISWRGYIFTAVCLCVCLCVCVYVCVRLCLWTKFQPNRRTHFDAVLSKWLLVTLARSLLKSVTLGQRSRSQWLNIFFFIILC